MVVREVTSAVVLAGGAGTRFGSDKRVADVDGLPMLRRVVDTVAAVAEDVIVAVAPGRPLPAHLMLPDHVRIVVDAAARTPANADMARARADTVTPADQTGPLAGLVAGLDAARHDLVVVLGGDHPWAHPETLAALRDRLVHDPALDAVVAADHRPQPLVGVYRRRAATIARSRLAAGDPRMTALLDHLRVALVDDAPGLADTVRDVDHPADLTADRDPGPDVGRPHARRTSHVRVVAIDRDGAVRTEVADQVTGEEPLAIRIAGPDGIPHDVTTTLRTPGHEVELAVGFLHAEGLLRSGEVARASLGDPMTDARPDDTVTVHLTRPVVLDDLVHRHVTATASCGLCGRATLDGLLDRVAPLPDGPQVPWSVIADLPDALRSAQATFAATGGLHATGIATADGRLVTVREDVGRHNALDAAIGVHVLAGTVPLPDHLVVLSGRVGFELVQKAAVAGAPIMVAVGAPSDLAVRAADEVGMTLVGFVRRGRGNVYTHPERIVLPPQPLTPPEPLPGA